MFGHIQSAATVRSKALSLITSVIPGCGTGQDLTHSVNVYRMGPNWDGNVALWWQGVCLAGFHGQAKDTLGLREHGPSLAVSGQWEQNPLAQQMALPSSV